MTLGIGKQWEPPRKRGDYRSAKGDMNAVPPGADAEAAAMRRRQEKAESPPAPGESDGLVTRVLRALGVKRE